MTDKPQPLVWDALQVAYALGLQADHGDDTNALRRSVQHLVNKGGLRPLRGIGRSLKFAPAEVSRFIEARLNETDP